MKTPKPKKMGPPVDNEQQEAAVSGSAPSTAKKYMRNPFAPKKGKKGC